MSFWCLFVLFTTLLYEIVSIVKSSILDTAGYCILSNFGTFVLLRSFIPLLYNDKYIPSVPAFLFCSVKNNNVDSSTDKIGRLRFKTNYSISPFYICFK